MAGIDAAGVRFFRNVRNSGQGVTLAPGPLSPPLLVSALAMLGLARKRRAVA